MKYYHTVLFEVSAENPIIGSIHNITDTPASIDKFTQSALIAITEHFNDKVTQGTEAITGAIEMILKGEFSIEIEVNTKGDGEDEYLHKIKVVRTWLY